MKAVTIIVNDKTAAQIERLVEKGRIRDYDAYTLALRTRPVNGERWVKVEEIDGEGWWRLPERVSCGA